jgi:hypothetical protein
LRTAKRNEKKVKEKNKKSNQTTKVWLPQNTHYFIKKYLNFLSCKTEGDALATMSKNIKSIVRTPDKHSFSYVVVVL